MSFELNRDKNDRLVTFIVDFIVSWSANLSDWPIWGTSWQSFDIYCFDLGSLVEFDNETFSIFNDVFEPKEQPITESHCNRMIRKVLAGIVVKLLCDMLWVTFFCFFVLLFSLFLLLCSTLLWWFVEAAATEQMLIIESNHSQSRSVLLLTIKMHRGYHKWEFLELTSL